ncbi:MAG: neutral/alkaline non-lysosomal ceramidase N-terminal domain-containing protein [Planctomycetota bacterium]
MAETIAALLLSITFLTGNGDGRASGWKAGTAKAVITPERKIWMAGYGSRDKPAEGTLHDLWIKALAIEDADGRRAVILTADLVGISQGVYEHVCAKLKEKLGLDRAQIMLTSSHTHCGPVLSDALKDIYPVNDEQIAWIDEYTRWLQDKMVDVLVEAVGKLAPATLSRGEGVARFAVNRRENPEADVPKLREQGDLKGPIDHAVPVLVVRDANEKLVSVLFGYACHNTTLSFYQWCGDYAGFAQIELEKSHPGAQAMFYMGCGADQNPLPRRTVELCENYGKQLAAAVDDVLRNSTDPLPPSLHTSFSMLELNLDAAPTREFLVERASGKGDYVARWAKRLLDDLDHQKPFRRTYPFPVQVWLLGGTQWWISLGGEVVVDYSLRLKQEIDSHLWITAYANDVMAYIPSLRVLREGGYEGQSSMMVYGMPAERWAPDVEELIVATVKRLVSQVRQADKSPKVSSAK